MVDLRLPIPTITYDKVAHANSQIAMGTSPASCRALHSTTGATSATSSPAKKLPAPALPGKKSTKWILFAQIGDVEPLLYSQHSQQRKRHRRHCLGWKSCQHVSDMSPRQPNVSTFGLNAPVVATQNWFQHFFVCRCLPTFTKFFFKCKSYILEFLCKIGSTYLFGIHLPWYLLAPLDALI